jgi:hypothetical protein
MSVKQYRTVKDAAQALLLKVSYVDVYGRSVGLTYKAILKRLHELFPNGTPNWPGYRTSLRSLQMIAYDLNHSSRIPVRRRSHLVLMRDYACVLLLVTGKDGMGLTLKSISRRAVAKYPSPKALPEKKLASLEMMLRREGFTVPPRG